MAQQSDTSWNLDLGVVPGWVWPAMAAIVVAGSIFFWTLAGLIWLAARPARQPVVIWVPPCAVQLANEQQLGDDATMQPLGSSSRE
jgi:hypothetical protein